jgi:hypothetical protein
MINRQNLRKFAREYLPLFLTEEEHQEPLEDHIHRLESLLVRFGEAVARETEHSLISDQSTSMEDAAKEGMVSYYE